MELFNIILSDGMLTGYLLNFCQEHYCNENLEFLLAVKKFSNLFILQKDKWLHYTQLDLLTEDDTLCIQNKNLFNELFDEFQQKQIEYELNYIWKYYLEPTNAIIEVCLPYEILDNTQRRIRLFKIYGPEIFDEAIVEPTKSMVRDIMPRYVSSEQFQEMMHRKNLCMYLPLAQDLKIPFPTSSRIIKLANLTSENIFNYTCDLNNYIKDKFLYNTFLIYLQNSMCAENLLCYRALDLFYDYMNNDNKKDGYELAWTIYYYFLCIGSAFEISLNYHIRYEVSKRMCKLDINTFDQVLKSLKISLEEQLMEYRMTMDFIHLQELLAGGSIETDNNNIESIKSLGKNIINNVNTTTAAANTTITATNISFNVNSNSNINCTISNTNSNSLSHTITFTNYQYPNSPEINTTSSNRNKGLKNSMKSKKFMIACCFGTAPINPLDK